MFVYLFVCWCVRSLVCCLFVCSRTCLFVCSLVCLLVCKNVLHSLALFLGSSGIGNAMIEFIEWFKQNNFGKRYDLYLTFVILNTLEP